jgi:hypothetical protein
MNINLPFNPWKRVDIYKTVVSFEITSLN